MSDSTKKPIVVAIDLDGTLLPETKKIPLLTCFYLRKLAKKGIQIVLASGRPSVAVQKYANQIGSKAPTVSFNGAITDSIHDKNYPTFKRCFAKRTVKEIYRLAKEANLIENMLVEDECNTWLLKQDKFLEKFFWINESKIHYGEIDETLHLDPLTVVFRLTETDNVAQKIAEVISKFPEINFRVWRNQQYAEIYQGGSSKAEALRYVAKYYGISIEDMIAFGDASNDLEMLEEVGYGVAMLNSSDKIKAIAQRISVADCEHEGVRKTLKLILKERNI